MSSSAKYQRSPAGCGKMGCSLHCYIEYRRPEEEDWQSFGHDIAPLRDTKIFSAIGISLPRGFPQDAGAYAFVGNSLRVSDDESDMNNPDCCTKEDASEYVSMGGRYLDADKRYVQHPDYRAHSWFTPDEFEKILQHSGSDAAPYHAILSVLKFFELKGYEARLVLWFDG